MSENKENVEQSMPTTEVIEAAIANMNPDVALRNLAFWLDVCIARGRWYDQQSAKSSDDAVSAPKDDTKSEV